MYESSSFFNKTTYVGEVYKLNVITLDLNDWNLCVKIKIFSIHSMNRRANWSLSERFPFFSLQSPYDMKESGTRSHADIKRPLGRREPTGSVSRVCVNKERDGVRAVPPSNFVTNSYGESWDSSGKKSCVPVQNQ